MANELQTVNDCLAMMGEAPLNSLVEEHVFKDSALRLLESNRFAILSEGWWFNTENLTLKVNPQDSRVYLPADVAAVRPTGTLVDRNRYVTRGAVMYDLEKGTDQFPAGFTLDVLLVRLLPITDLPVSVNLYITHKTMLDFQQAYDGDQTKTRNLSIEVYGNAAMNIPGLRGLARAEHIRNVGLNFIGQSERFSRIRRVISYASRY